MKTVFVRYSNIKLLKDNGINHLYHFTDLSNLASIRKKGLMSASNLLKHSIPAKLNSNELSRKLDTKAGLEDFVRLSFCPNNPMMHVAKKEGRISNPYSIHLDGLFKDVRFSDCNAARRDASLSETQPSTV